MPGKKRPVKATKSVTATRARRVIAKPVAAPEPVQPFDDHQIRRLELRVGERVGTESLTPAAQTSLATGLAPLNWLNDLMPDARSTLAGDADAAARLRVTLTRLGETAHDAARDARAGRAGSPSNQDQSPQWTALPQRRLQTNSQAVAQLASAAIWASDDEAQAQLMLDGLAAALAASHWAHELLKAVDSAPSQGASIRSLTMALDGFGGFDPRGFDDGGLDPLGPKDPKLPKDPKGGLVIVIPGKSIGDLIPGKWWQHIVHDPETPGGLRLDVPIYVEPCILRAIAAMSRMRADATHWSITGIDNPHACPGSVITLTGTGFGISKGTVTFAAANHERTNGTVTSWSDTKITVRIPSDAIPGDIMIEALAGTVRMCGGEFPVMRSGTSLVEFRGGVAEISYFDLRNGATHRVDFNTVTRIDLVTTAGADIRCGIEVWHGPTLLTKLDNLPGGAHTLTFTTPNGPVPRTLRCVAKAANGCGTTHREFFLIVGPKPVPKIDTITFVQGIQYPALPISGKHTPVNVIEKRATLARVYVRSPFDFGLDFGANPGEISVTGSLRLTSSVGTVVLTPINAPFAAQPVPSIAAALDFELPPDLLVGTVTADATVWPTSTPAGTGYWPASSSATTTFTPSGQLTFVQLLVRDDLAPHAAAAPSAADWSAGVLSIAERFPLSPGRIYQIPSVAQPSMGTGKHDLMTKDGWHEVLADVYDIADDHKWAKGSDVIWLAMTPTNTSYGLNGTSNAGGIRRAAVQGTLRGSIAHEITHTLGVLHAPAADSPAGMPTDIDKRLPTDGQIEPGTVGWRPSDDLIFTHPWPELMSYQTPDAAGYPAPAPPPGQRYQDRWPSATLWDILIEQIG